LIVFLRVFLLAGLGLAVHVLWVLAVIASALWLLGFAARRLPGDRHHPPGAGRRIALLGMRVEEPSTDDVSLAKSVDLRVDTALLPFCLSAARRVGQIPRRPTVTGVARHVEESRSTLVMSDPVRRGPRSGRVQARAG
jgi:hypothetical protein